MMQQRESQGARMPTAFERAATNLNQISRRDNNNYDSVAEGSHYGESGHEDSSENDSSHEEEQGIQLIDENEVFRGPQASTRSERATPLSSSRQKQSLPVQSTISDDRSQGSEFLRSGRILLALKQPAANDESRGERNSDNSSGQQSRPSKQASQDYQMQLMLLEQQNKKRLLKAREKERQLIILQQQQAQQEQEQRQQTFIEHSDSLTDALQLVARALNIQDEPTLTIEALQAYVLDLNSNNKAQKSAVPIVQLVHRVLRHDKSPKSEHMYLDQPLWLEGATSTREAFAGSLPLRSVSSYLSKHPEVCCIIYRDYDVSFLIGTEPQDEDLDAIISPEHIGEFIEPVTTSLAAAITKFFDYYKFNTDNTADPNSTKLRAPYVAIYHARRDNLTCFLETLEDRQQLQFQTILHYVFSRYGNDYSLVDKLTGEGKITQGYIKYLFKPGDIIVRGKDQDARGFLCESWLEEPMSDNSNFLYAARNNTKQKRIFDISAWSWDFDGKFSHEQSILKLEFDAKDFSEKRIENLDIRPLANLNESMKERLKDRGKWFWKCRTKHIVSYDDTLQELRHSSDERYMIDMPMYHELHQHDYRKRDTAKPFTSDYLGPEAVEQEDPPDEIFFYLAPLTVKAYNLKRKKWVDLRLDGLREVSWNTQAFESLVLKGKTKRLIQALISNQIEAERSTDLISGKGNGLILLLHGGPGTGKTLTAESVAEIAKKPLYPVTCGDIGTKPEDVENYLESVLYLGKTWGCVVLLDEADVFLEQRSLEDLHRNALVSVFLRVLEYYDGILILTSNRVGTFDEAFKSRIQLAVHYSSLTTHQRIKIWGNFIQRLKELNEEGIDFLDLEDNIEQLASKEMNGREIRNAITTARQYARWERQQAQEFKLNYNVMKEVIETAGEFDEYINTLNGGMTQEQLAKEDGLR